MLILSPQSVRTTKALGESFAQKTLELLNERVEEARRTLVEVQDESRRIEGQQKELIAARNLQIFELNKEITKLENARRAEMIPVEKLQAKLEAEVRKTKEAKTKLDTERAIAEKRQREYIEGLEKVEAESDQLQSRQENLDIREKGLALQETEALQRIKTFSEQLQQHQKAVRDSNAALKAKEEELMQREHAVEVLKKSLAAEEKSFVARERALQDKYKTLERTINRLE